MPRYFTPIAQEELEAKINKLMDDGDGPDPHYLVEKLKKDLKVKFDLENVAQSPNDFGPKKLMGIQTLDNGLTFHGFCAGGDWEQPVFFMVYFDGKKLRGYVPTDGNPWNTTTKQAYGNDEDDDLKNAKKRYSELLDPADEDWPESFDDINPSFNEDEILADIKGRILPKTL